MMDMEINDTFPDFELVDENGEAFNSSSLDGLRYVIYFYSKDETAGCTREAEDFSALYPKFMLRNVPIFGVSRDTAAKHRAFKDNHSLKIKLLSDPDRTLMTEADAWGTKTMYGKEVTGTRRSTYVVGKDGRIEAAWKNVKVAGHADKVLDKVISLTKRV